MLLAAWRDLQFRKRRVIVTVIGTSLVFALTLVLGGLAARFDAEASEAADLFQADHWVIRDDATGPLIGEAFFPADALDVGDGVAFGFVSVDGGSGDPVRAAAFGVEPGGLGAPEGLEDGRAFVSSEVGVDRGATVHLGSDEFEVAGALQGATVLAGLPVVVMTLDDLSAVAFAGQPVVGARAVRGDAPDVPDGFRVVDGSAARADLIKPVEDPKGAVGFVSVLLWCVAGLIIGATVYLSVLERTRDFAVFKAIGVADRSLVAGVVLQSLVVAFAAAAIGSVVAQLIAPTFPMTVEISGLSVVVLFAVATVVGLVVSLIGVRRVSRVDPASAFGGP